MERESDLRPRRNCFSEIMLNDLISGDLTVNISYLVLWCLWRVSNVHIFFRSVIWRLSFGWIFGLADPFFSVIVTCSRFFLGYALQFAWIFCFFFFTPRCCSMASISWIATLRSASRLAAAFFFSRCFPSRRPRVSPLISISSTISFPSIMRTSPRPAFISLFSTKNSLGFRFCSWVWEKIKNNELSLTEAERLLRLERDRLRLSRSRDFGRFELKTD